jgi:hypothetical protein
VLLSDQEALQIIAVLADVHDGHDVRDAVGAAWSLLNSTRSFGQICGLSGHAAGADCAAW